MLPMQEKHLHIVSFNVPYPANYGGVIDVFHKLRWLHKLGVKVHLHCFRYGRPPAPELNQYCESVHYYARDIGLFAQASLLPYIVYSRRHPALLHRLTLDNHPILLEGLHSCYYLPNENLSDRKKYFRESNIEHEYYQSLIKNESDIFHRLYLWLESKRLKNFEPVIKHATQILTVTEADKKYFNNLYNTPAEVLHSFHSHDTVDCKPGTGNYILYHGNLSVRENKTAAKFIVKELAKLTNRKIIIAGMNPDNELKSMVKSQSNVQLVANPSATAMDDLLSNAHINLLYTEQSTGLKLKLINALYKGRFCLVNDTMLHGIQLDRLCSIANSVQEFAVKIESLFNLTFGDADISKRREVLEQEFGNRKNAEKLVQLIFDTRN